MDQQADPARALNIVVVLAGTLKYGLIVDGLDAWRILQGQGHQISLVLTDIEMPNLDGIGLAKRIRSDPSLRDIPVMALTTLASDLDIEGGKAVGLCGYQIKLDKDNLLAAIRQITGKDSL